MGARQKSSQEGKQGNTNKLVRPNAAPEAVELRGTVLAAREAELFGAGKPRKLRFFPV